MNKTNAERLHNAIKEVGEELCSLSNKEFQKELDRHEYGDIARMLLESSELCARHDRNSGAEVKNEV